MTWTLMLWLVCANVGVTQKDVRGFKSKDACLEAGEDAATQVRAFSGDARYICVATPALALKPGEGT